MRHKALAASIIGNIIEWYDFGLFIYLAPLLSQQFFPAEDKMASLLMTLAVFAAGFIMRPIGALLFGRLGDRIGRARTLKITILIISLPSIIIALCPTYADWGLTATLILVLMRLLQGLCIGGEFAGAMVYLVETAPTNRRCFFSSFNNVGSNIGLIAATSLTGLLSLLMSEAQFTHYGWRLTFMLGGLLGLIGLVLRRYLIETEAFLDLQQQNPQPQSPFRQLFIEHRAALLQMILILFVTASGCYALMNLLSTYLQTYLQFSLAQAMQVQTGFLTFSLFAIPLTGWLADRVGAKQCLWFASIGFVLFSLPCYYLLATTHQPLVLLPLVCFFCIEQAVVPSILAQTFPPQIRYLGASMAYNTTLTLIGGSAPVVLVYLIETTQITLMPALHLLFAGLITGVVLSLQLNQSPPEIDLA